MSNRVRPVKCASGISDVASGNKILGAAKMSGRGWVHANDPPSGRHFGSFVTPVGTVCNPRKRRPCGSPPAFELGTNQLLGPDQQKEPHAAVAIFHAPVLVILAHSKRVKKKTLTHTKTISTLLSNENFPEEPSFQTNARSTAPTPCKTGGYSWSPRYPSKLHSRSRRHWCKSESNLACWSKPK